VTRVEWTDLTDNHQGGCVPSSPACHACYAKTMSHRFCRRALYAGTTGGALGRGAAWTGRINVSEERLRTAFARHARTRTKRFAWLGSMSDIMLPALHAPEALARSRELLADLIRQYDPVMRGTGRVRLLLTKHPHVLLSWQLIHFPEGLPPWVWVGITGETQTYLDRRMHTFRQVNAAVRFVSAEPLLGPLSIDRWLPDLGWIIAGGETDQPGRRARPSHPDWFRALRDACAQAGTAFFFKQWGNYGPSPDHSWTKRSLLVPKAVAGTPHTRPDLRLEDDAHMRHDRRKAAHGRLLDGVEHNDRPRADPSPRSLRGPT
jgi:protein gp37